MNYNDYNQSSKRRNNSEWRCPVSLLLILLVVAIVATMLFTSHMTSQWVRKQDGEIIAKQQQTIDTLRDSISNSIDKADEFSKLDTLASLLEYYSYYTNEFNKEEMLDAALRAYVAATGDKYAAYYTEEEYAAIRSDKAGEGVGIGVSVVQEPLMVNGQIFLTFHISKIFKGAPAESSSLRVGDRIYAIEIDGEYKSVEQLGGYAPALNTLRGEVGSVAKLLAFRVDEDGSFSQVEASIVRNTYTKESVSFRISETDPKVGIVHLEEFDLQAPLQFKEAVKALQAKGVERFVFDVRNNPGGDIESVRGVLSFLLEDQDLILKAVNNQGVADVAVYAGEVTHTGAYTSCSVSAEEVGMFADLKMVVLCNENTASSAEIFTASLRDHKNVTIVGQTTFGKGILQHTLDLSKMSGGLYTGHLKMTTYAYVTECGITYHGIGIHPTEGYDVALSEEAQEYYFSLLPESIDNQLQMAIKAVQSK
jgi:carboxyl-terminal processing protease